MFETTPDRFFQCEKLIYCVKQNVVLRFDGDNFKGIKQGNDKHQRYNAWMDLNCCL